GAAGHGARLMGRVVKAQELAVAVGAPALLVATFAEAERVLAAAGPAAAVLAAKMAERIVGRAGALDPSVMAEIAGEALAACRPRGRVGLRAHPDDLAALEARCEALLARLPAGTTLELVPDETVGRAGCIVETSVGRVDARLEAQI